MDAPDFAALAATCAPQVSVVTTRALVQTESAFNPHAIGVVAGHLDRQPATLAEALATSRRLQRGGFDYSVGLAQINVRNFPRLGLSATSAFDPCTNLAAMQTLLASCYERAERTGASAQRALRQSFSCYYSGDFTTGFEHGYVARVIRAGVRAQPSGLHLQGQP